MPVRVSGLTGDEIARMHVSIIQSSHYSIQPNGVFGIVRLLPHGRRPTFCAPRSLQLDDRCG